MFTINVRIKVFDSKKVIQNLNIKFELENEVHTY